MASLKLQISDCIKSPLMWAFFKAKSYAGVDLGVGSVSSFLGSVLLSVEGVVADSSVLIANALNPVALVVMLYPLNRLMSNHNNDFKYLHWGSCRLVLWTYVVLLNT